MLIIAGSPAGIGSKVTSLDIIQIFCKIRQFRMSTQLLLRRHSL
jgi:hypothetical protein